MKSAQKLAACAVAFGALAGGTATASASSTDGRETTITRTVATQKAGALAAGCTVYAYGYRGTAKCDSDVLVVTWSSGRYETFVIAPDRTIWHAWPGAGGWHVMPGNGRADDTYSAWWSGANRVVSVWVNGVGRYCSTDPSTSASWGSWYRC